MSEVKANRQRYQVRPEEMTTHLVEDRRAVVSCWGRGNSKIGPGVFTYSKTAGRVASCPGSTPHCESVCYAKRMATNGWLFILYGMNDMRGDALPELPEEAELVRGHVSGDFDTVGYIQSWTRLAESRPHCRFWFYTRSWRVPELLPHLEVLRALPNVQLWASVDKDCEELPPEGWRRAWLNSDDRAMGVTAGKVNFRTTDDVFALVCLEETGTKANCVDCGYCFRDADADVIFLEHLEPNAETKG